MSGSCVYKCKQANEFQLGHYGHQLFMSRIGAIQGGPTLKGFLYCTSFLSALECIFYCHLTALKQIDDFTVAVCIERRGPL